MLKNIKYPVVKINIPEFRDVVSTFNLEDDEIVEVDVREIEIKPSRSLKGLEKFIDHIIYKIRHYDEDREAEYLILNERDYRDLVWYFANQDNYIQLFNNALNADIILLDGVESPKVAGDVKDDFISMNRSDD